MRVLDGMSVGGAEAHDVSSTRLIKAAHEFEAQLLKEMLKPLTEDKGFCGDESDSGSGGILKDFAGEALGQTLSVHGGLGIAKSIVQSLSHPRDGAGNEIVGVEGGLQFRTHRDR